MAWSSWSSMADGQQRTMAVTSTPLTGAALETLRDKDEREPVPAGGEPL
jgi:hypothetical protein